jgi:hypothetical protein
MPVQHAIWQVGAAPVALPTSKLVNEQLLEDMIVQDPRILSTEWMLIGRQETIGQGCRVDLLAIAPDGALVLIELKRDRTPREVVAQALEYASWLSTLTGDRIVQIYSRFAAGRSLDVDFRRRFGVPLDEETLNHTHQIILVAAELDASTERIVEYLNKRDIAINVVFFQVFTHGDHQLLSRSWLIDPAETQVNAASTTAEMRDKEPWNGEFYVSYGGNPARIWDEARALGFISAGGGRWYSQTLKQLSPGDRIWVKAPGVGYVGVGHVVDSVQPAKEFKVASSDGDRPVLEVMQRGDAFKPLQDDEDLSEYFVRVRWRDTVPLSGAFNEVGLFGNQNSVCRPQTPKWRHTIERMKTVFKNWDTAGK